MPKNKSNGALKTEFIINTNSSTPQTNKQRLNRNRYEAQKITLNQRARKCGNTPIGKISICTDGKHAAWGGVMTCGSVWNCPPCNAKIMAKRRGELLQAFHAHEIDGGFAVMETFTVPHTLDDTAENLTALLRRAFGEYNKSRQTKKLRNQYKQIGYCRTMESVHGEDSGWNHHFILVHFVESPMSATEIDNWAIESFRLWAEAVEKISGRTAAKSGYDVRPVTDFDGLAGYLTKQSDRGPALPPEGVLESTKPPQKGLNPWQLLNAWILTGDKRSKELWTEYERAVKGFHFISWSAEIRNRLGLASETTDVELAADDEPGFKAAMEIEEQSFWKLLRHHPIKQAKYLEYFELLPLETFCKLLEADGINYSLTSYGEGLINKRRSESRHVP